MKSLLVNYDTIKMFINIVNSYMLMEFDELLITTGVDALVKLVKEKQRIELEDACSVLNIPSETLEDWARVLEEEGILRIEYKLTKIYLLWVKPSEEELATEKKTFYEGKANVSTEVEQVKGKVAADITDMGELKRTFADFYSKAYPKIDALEKKVANLPAASTIGTDVLTKHEEELKDMESKINETEDALGQMKSEVEGLGVSKGKGRSEELLERLEKMGEELGAYKKEMDDLRRRASREGAPGQEVQMPSSREMKKKFDMIQKDFTALRSKNAQIRQDMLSLHESSEILKTVAESIMGQDDKIVSLKSEMDSLAEDAVKIETRTKAIVTQVRQNADFVERLGDSVDVAKTVLKKFPAQERVLLELDKLKNEEESILEKSESLEKILEAAGGKQITAKQFTELAKKMDERALQMRKDMDALETALEDEKGTYLTFQKIKEKVVPTIEAFQQQLSDMQKRIDSIKADSFGQMDAIRNEAQKLQQSLKSPDVQEAVKVAQEIHEKKGELDEIRVSLEELVTMSDNINKRITLLSREAKLLEIRSSGGTPGSGGTGSGGEGGETDKSKESRANMGLSPDEELEFRQKREELKKLIQKLWEQ